MSLRHCSILEFGRGHPIKQSARHWVQPESSRTRVYLLCVFVPPPKGRSHFTKLLTRALFFVPCHCSYIFVLCPAFYVHVARDLNKAISFVAGITRAHTLEPKLPYAIKYCLKHNSYWTEYFLKQ